MPVTVIVGGQYGSEGKGKVAHFWAERTGAKYAVRVGGSNSGHTAVQDGEAIALRHIPTPTLLPGAPTAVLPPGSYIDLPVLLREIEQLGLTPEQLLIDPLATVVQEEDRQKERDSHLRSAVGSTLSGTGAAVVRRIHRKGTCSLAREELALQPYLTPTGALLREALNRGERVILEGTQGFGLSLLHNEHYPYATSRDTTAAAVVSEAGLSPLDVDQILLVIRAFPIRVGGNSGPLPLETSWGALARRCGRPGLEEFTTVTGRSRRVAEFDPGIVKSAIDSNNPTHLILNHVDYLGGVEGGSPTLSAISFVRQVEESLARQVDFVGTGPSSLYSSRAVNALAIEDQRVAHSESGRASAYATGVL